jgi:hypothetical protein
VTRLPHLIAAALIATPLAAAPALAQSAGMQAEFAAPFERAQELVISGKAWNCSGTTCVTRSSDARPAVACRKLARKVGRPVARFAAAQAPLAPADLAACNQDHG